MAADSEEIATVVRGFGGQVFLTSPDCASGTDRIAEVAQKLGNVDVIVNVQGDEPELSGAAIDLVVDLLEWHSSAQMATLATPIRSKEKLVDPACVKVVMAALESSGDKPPASRALYFSRAAIPHGRNGTKISWPLTRLISSSILGSTPIGEISYCDSPNCRVRRWRNLKTWSNFAC